MRVWIAIFEGLDEHELLGVYTMPALAEMACDAASGGILRDYYKIHPFVINQPWIDRELKANDARLVQKASDEIRDSLAKDPKLT
jgi:hypothetical protein